MTIEKTVENDSVTLSLEGWLDTQAAPELESALEEIGEGTTALTFDCARLEYISSSGIRQIVAAYKKMNGKFTLKNVSAEIMDVLNMTGIAKKISIE